MCGRFSLFSPPARVARFFHATVAGEVEGQDRPHWNIGPTSPVLGVRASRRHDQDDTAHHEQARRVDLFRWGLVPRWADDLAIGNRLFNARAETVATKPSFRSAFERHRLVVPADGFFEWEKAPGRRSQPHYFHRTDGSPMALAGLWELWHDPRDPQGYTVRSCAIITVDASTDLQGIHDRMPLVLEPDVLEDWLDPGSAQDELEALLLPTRSGILAHHRVDPRMGNARYDDPSVIAEAGGCEDRAGP